MQKIDRPGVDFHQHVLSDQLIEIMAGGISLHRETPGQPAGGKDLAQVIRIEKIGLILQKSQQFRFTHRIPLFAITKGYDAGKERLIDGPCCFFAVQRTLAKPTSRRPDPSSFHTAAARAAYNRPRQTAA